MPKDLLEEVDNIHEEMVIPEVWQLYKRTM